MSFPKRNTRQITIADEVYLWHLNQDFDLRNTWLVIAKRGIQGQLLYLDPYHHDLLIGPGSVRRAIEFAHSVGWEPAVKKQPMRLRYNGDDFSGPPFAVLPENARIGE
jgi:hypothetical protein